MHINILTSGFDIGNAPGFFYPLIKYRNQLRKEYDITWKSYQSVVSDLYDCDILIVERNFYKHRWDTESCEILAQLEQFKQNIDKLIFFDLEDSTGIPHFKMLPYVDFYLKNQVLKDRTLYLKPMLHHRLFAQYYHQNFNINDQKNVWSEPITNIEDLKKIKVGWNSSIADYSILKKYRNKLYRWTHWSWILRYPKSFVEPHSMRPLDLSCRVTINYPQNTIAFQRKKLIEILSDKIETQKTSKRQYHKELKNAKIVLSPFGGGEICYRDYETFLAGSLLLKPNMSHIETWPNLYHEHQTYVPFNWDLSDIRDKVNECLVNYSYYMDIAKKGQDNYRQYLTGPKACELFCKRFFNLMTS